MNNVFEFSDGTKVTIDHKRISWTEWRGLVRGTLGDKEDEIIAKLCGISDEELLVLYDLPQPEIRKFFTELLESGRRPLADPNSASESTSE